mmetsp:Transcript_61157/g.124084  ORF Transcript_61157/g.124084 Transcript_61157/m.124084 type:complete len:286 (+) Transcript_61157:144-1001(+)
MELSKMGFVDVPLSMEVPYPNPKRPELSIGWLKLAVWNLTTWDRIVVLDADMLAIGPLEGAFFPASHVPPLSLITSPMGAPNSFRSVNIGVMSIQPSARVFETMLRELHSFDHRTNKPDSQDQGWIEMFFKRWGSFGGVYDGAGSCVDAPQFMDLGFATEDGFPWCFHRPEYNAYADASYIEKIRASGASPKLVHWPGILKPWCLKKKQRSVFDEMWWAAAKTSWEALDHSDHPWSIPSSFNCDLHIFSQRKWKMILARRKNLSRVWSRAKSLAETELEPLCQIM